MINHDTQSLACSHEKTCSKRRRSFLGLFLPMAMQPLITDLWDIVPIALRVSLILTIQATLTSDTVSFVPDSTRSLGAQSGHAFAMPLSCLYYTELHQATLTKHPFHLFLDHPDSLLLELTLTFRSKQEPFGPQLSCFQSPDHPTVGYTFSSGSVLFLYNVHTPWLFVTVLPVEHRAFLRQATPTQGHYSQGLNLFV